MNGIIVDLFAGGGGASLGIERALGRSPDIAIDHHSLCVAEVNGKHAGEVAEFLRRYAGVDVRDVVELEIDGVSYAITDIRLRMLQPVELQRAQGFGDGYVIEGTKRDRVRLIGNSVCPPVAEAVIRSNTTGVGVIAERQEALFA